MRSLISKKLGFIFIWLCLYPVQQAIANMSLTDKINDVVSNVENKTKYIFNDGQVFNVYNNSSFNDNSSSFMIQKEKEKLSIIPIYPLGINNNKNDPYDFKVTLKGHYQV